ncbi:MAG: hypothetical protein LUC98_05135 [Lachnospiraceae bacterium]|nr:hypothetical protein [Lachnospiraceae bacterium]
MSFVDTAKALSQAAEDTKIGFLATRLAANEMNEIKSEIERRIETDKEKTRAEVAELERLAADTSRTATARKMSALQLERLKAYRPSVLPDELAAFNEKHAEATQALADWRTAEKKLRELLRAAKDALEAMAPGKLTQGADPQLLQRTIEHHREKFDLMVVKNSGK